MPATILEKRELTVREWSNVADDANPAVPLYLAGAFAEADITIAGRHPISTTLGNSLRTISHTLPCC